MVDTVEAPDTAGFIKLPLAIFRNHAAPDADIYCLLGEQEEPTLFASRELGITDTQLDSLEKKGQHALYISSNDLYRAMSPLLDTLEDVVADDSCSADERFSVLQYAIAQEVDRTFRMTNCSHFVSLSNRIGTQIANLVSQETVTPQQLFSIARHDSTTFVHSTNVAAYTVMLAQALGVSRQEQLRQIGVGAMLHDYGKRSIPQEILTKPGKLTAEERAVIEAHPQLGYEDLYEQENLNHGQLMMIYQHHEWINGGGYPVAILGKEIHPWAKILAIVDVFDAITSSRPYSPGMCVNDALKFLEDGEDKHFEPEAVKCWTSIFRQHSQK